MIEPAIQVEGISKQYHLGQGISAQHTLGERLYECIGNTYNKLTRRTAQHKSAPRETFWAVKDINFEAETGKVFGVIGRNGAGKSTLLKILSQITEPTHGRAIMRGRVGSLLEVGTGFHPELTGRENVFLNGAILGMKRREVAEKFDEIVGFAELEKFIDTPVKRYSSGMYVRLAFAVAAHLEPEVLLIDEVLAVGDAGFQQRCLGRMSEIADGGRTIVFVSHDMGAVARLCDRVMLLEGGETDLIGTPSEAIERYHTLVSNWRENPEGVFTGPLADDIRFEDLTINGIDAEGPRVFNPHDTLTMTIKGIAKTNVPRFRTTFCLYKDNIRLLSKHDAPEPIDLPAGPFTSEITLPAYLLRPGDYRVSIGGHRDALRQYIWGRDLMGFTVTEQWSEHFDKKDVGMINVPGYGTRTLGKDTDNSIAA